MNSNRLPILCATLLFGFAGVAGQAGCSDSETSTGDTLRGGGGNVGGNTAGAGGIGGVGNNGGGGNIGGNMGGGGQGGMTPNGTDTCDGTAVSIGPNDAFNSTGDTSGMADDYSSACEGTSGADVVYALTVEDAGTLSVTLTGGGDADISMYLRATCDDPDTQLWCRNGAGTGNQRSFTTHINPGTYHFFVDGDSTPGGPFNLALALTAPDCPDGATNPGEECDDGNLDTGDGCDDMCEFEDGSLNDCATAVIAANVQDLVLGLNSFPGNTLGNDNLYSFNQTQCGITDDSTIEGGKDRIHAFVSQVTGTARIRVGWPQNNADPSYCETPPGETGCWDRTVSVRHVMNDGSAGACGDVMNQIACGASPGVSPDFAQDFTIPVVSGQTYFVFVDSYWDGGMPPVPTFVSGEYWLHIEVTNP